MNEEEIPSVKKALSENLIIQSILKYFDSLTDLQNIALVNKFLYEEVMNIQVPECIVKPSNRYEINFDYTYESKLVGEFCEEKERYQYFEEVIERLSSICRENLSFTKEIVIPYAFNVGDVGVPILERLGKEGATFIDKLFDLFENAECLQFIDNSSEDEGGLLSFILKEIKSNKIKIINGIDVNSLEKFFSHYNNNNDDEVCREFFYNTTNLKAISLEENENIELCNVERLIDSLINKNVFIIKLNIFFNENNINFFKNIISFTPNNSEVQFELVFNKEMCLETLEYFMESIPIEYYDKICSITATCKTIEVIKKLNTLINSLIELRSLHLEVMFVNEDSRMFDELIQGNGHHEYIKENFYLFEIKKNVNIKKLSITFNDTKSMFTKHQINDREMAKYYFTKSLLSSIPLIETLELNNLQQTDKLASVIVENNKKLRNLLLYNSILSGRCLNELRNVKFLFLSPPNLIPIPSFVELLIVVMKKGTYMCGVDASQRIIQLSNDELQIKLKKRYKFKYTSKIVNENEDIYFLFFNNPLFFKKYLKINDIMI
uniref:F-box domain-containing protein n=1 Tax=Strongyloides stercoralis TaxID=6248 RepID=A0A0K0EBF0_STRER